MASRPNGKGSMILCLHTYFKSKMSHHGGPEKYQNVLRICLNGPVVLICVTMWWQKLSN